MTSPPASTPRRCPRCGRPLPDPQGLCTGCLGRLVFAPEITPPANLPDPLGSRRWLGDYELIEELARGGMGKVYRARQLSLNREVAVKLMLHGTLASAEDVERFRAEASAAASLKHPGITAIHEVGEVDGQHFFSMELIPGRDLGVITRDGPLPVRQAAEVLTQIADAVQHAHERGILHRDLKPSNIILDPEGRAHVTDFGLARRTNAATALTQSGQMLGTPGYMSPEQASGRRSIGPATDIYSLGAVLYHLLTGRAPFVGETPSAILRQVEESDPVTPRALNPATSKDLETICLKCLQKEPARRYSTAAELREDLGRFLREEPIRARPTGALEQGWRWCRRRPGLTAALTGIAVLLVVITAVSTISAHRIDYLRQVAYTNLYAADMRLVQQAVSESKFGTAVDLLERHLPKPGEPDLRGFEWYYLWETCRSDEVATLGRHADQAQRATFSPDGRLVATAAADVKIWDMANHQLLDHFERAGFVWALEFSADSRRLAAAFQDAWLDCYDIAERRASATLTRLGIRPLALQWDENRPLLTIFGADQSYCWDTAADKLARTNGLGKGIQRLALALKARSAVAARTPYDLSVLDLIQRSEIGRVKLANPIRSLAISPDGQTIVTGDYAGNLDARRVSNLQERRLLKDHRGMIAAESFSANGGWLASGGVDQLIHLWNTTNWSLARALRGHRSPVFAIALSPDSHWLVSGDKSGEVKLWDLANHNDPLVTAGSGRGILATDGSIFAFENSNRVSVIWLRGGRAIERTVNAPLEPIPFAVSSNGFALADGSGQFFQPGAGARAGRSKLPESLPNSLSALSPDGRYYVYVEPETRAQAVWDNVEHRRLCAITNAPSAPSAPTIAADNYHFAEGSADGQVYVSDLRSGAALARFRAHRGWCYACSFSPDGQQLATAGFDGVVVLSEAKTGRKIAEFRSSADAYWSVALSPDGRRVAAGTGESTIVLWDVASQQEVASLNVTEHISPVEGGLRFSPDGTALIFAGPDRWRVWSAPKPPKDS